MITDCCDMTKAMLTHIIVMDFPIPIKAIRMGLSIMYYKGLQVGITQLWCISDTEDCFYLNKQCRP